MENDPIHDHHVDSVQVDTSGHWVRLVFPNNKAETGQMVLTTVDLAPESAISLGMKLIRAGQLLQQREEGR